MATPREHIEEIRRDKFSIGGKENPLTEDLHHAVKHLSAELYTKDVHFLMELIQNAEDNEYEPDVEPSLEFVVTSRDVTGVGAPATLLVFNNEKGFTPRNIVSLCSVGQSTKKGKRQGGYIGEKGIGFKSVFLVTSQPYIFSNGYKIRFNEIPPSDSGVKIGYIVPEWIDKPNIEDLKRIYSSQSQGELPNTAIVLPLRPEKVDGVKEQLANIHPEVILFMSKIKRLSVREDGQNQNPRVHAVCVSQEIAFQDVKKEGSESFTLHLSAEENGKSNGECSYYMWRQRFPVKSNNRVEERSDIDNWVITLAFPLEDRVTTGNRVGAGVYAFLPTEIVTNLPFIIQADFLLASSRESILWDNKWNQGILDCIPSAFL
ncbi:protein NO VEIN-like [Cryptomeria japonica]|uniref:protein NO VEIN-like n=1 Tax=Cryptomeria japonica TaxID=3369 RepID=UPI0027D9E29C|nr:protein NO VEIN-like [Cryptomeria japonica]